MTTTQVEPERPEPLSQRAARRLRGCLAENRISQSELARVVHMPQQKLSRKVTGFTPLTVDEIETIAWALEIEPDAILGIGAWKDRPIGLCAIRDSNPEPADSEPLAPILDLVDDSADKVIPIRPSRRRNLLIARPRSLTLVHGGAA